jgi:hypothetical protein
MTEEDQSRAKKKLKNKRKIKERNDFVKGNSKLLEMEVDFEEARLVS